MIDKKIINEIIVSSNKKYLDNVLKNIDIEKHEYVKKLFNKHMLEISEYCYNTFFIENKFDENFIKTLHKIHYPPNHKETIKKDNIEIVYMIPGVYRSNENYGWVQAKDVKKEMKLLLEKYKNINTYDGIFSFILDFFRIHPFGDGNGRIASILLDLLLLKNSFKPYFLREKLKDKQIEKNIFESIKKSLQSKDYSFFLEEIKKY